MNIRTPDYVMLCLSRGLTPRKLEKRHDWTAKRIATEFQLPTNTVRNLARRWGLRVEE